ncbi:MAG: cysteine desulfurase [Nitrospirae bacterium]|nr:cysteine desulfurase [Nitrospirota bacterium]
MDVARIRRDFPILKRKVRGRPLVYLDNAATTQKPAAVIEAIRDYYSRYNANIHRGVHQLSEQATDGFEKSRELIRSFLGAGETREIVFVRGATEGINLVAQSLGRKFVSKGDEIVVTTMEHHSNIVPWQMLCEGTGAVLRVVPISDRGELELDSFDRLLSSKTRLVAVTHVSNALGTVNPIDVIVRHAHSAGAAVLVDGAQAVPHMKVDVKSLDCDFYVFSSHKVYGPTGIGVVYGKRRWLEEMPPYQGGGDMIASVTFEKTLYNRLPYKFEAGTPDIAGAIGLGAALEYVNHIGLGAIARHETDLLIHAAESLEEIDGVRLIGKAAERAAVVSFVVDGVHPHDLGTFLDQEGIAIRTGHHCAQPVMQRYGIPATARASFGMYNTKSEVDALAKGIRKAQEFFA